MHRLPLILSRLKPIATTAVPENYATTKKKKPAAGETKNHPTKHQNKNETIKYGSVANFVHNSHPAPPPLPFTTTPSSRSHDIVTQAIDPATQTSPPLSPPA